MPPQVEDRKKVMTLMQQGLQNRSTAERVFFFDISEHADGERRGACSDLKVPKGAPHRDLSDATL